MAGTRLDTPDVLARQQGDPRDCSVEAGSPARSRKDGVRQRRRGAGPALHALPGPSTPGLAASPCRARPHAVAVKGSVVP